MMLEASNELLLYKIFPTNLHALTLSWFHGLLEGFINSFRTLCEAFMTQYRCSICPKGEPNSLLEMWISPKEMIY